MCSVRTIYKCLYSIILSLSSRVAKHFGAEKFDGRAADPVGEDDADDLSAVLSGKLTKEYAQNQR